MADIQEKTPQGGSKEEREHIPQTQGQEQDNQNDSGTGGLLAPILDPVGKGLGKALSPIGYGVEKVTKPIASGVGGITRPALGPLAGEQEEKSEVLGGNNKDSYTHGKDSLGKREQTGENPLGLDQTGKFGFQDE